MSARRYLKSILGADAVAQAERVAAWQRRPAKWAIVDEIRRHDGRGARPRWHPLLGDELSERPTPAETAEQRDAVEHVRARVEALPERLRRLVKLRLDGRTGADIAAAWGISERRVWALWRKALDGIGPLAPDL